MRRVRRGVWAAVSLLVMLLSFASCSKSDNAEPAGDTKTVQVQFTITVDGTSGNNSSSIYSNAKSDNAKSGNAKYDNANSGNAKSDNAKSGNDASDGRNSGSTRADDDKDWTKYDPAEDGEGIENRIDVGRLHVVLYSTDADGHLASVAGEVKNLSVTSSSDGDRSYNVYGSMEIPTDRLIDEETFRGRVMVFANADDPNSMLTGSVIPQLTYSYSPDNSHGNPGNLSLSSIPMWGISPVRTISLRGGVYNDLGGIDLLRSMAKVKVTLRSDMTAQGFSLQSVVMNRYNTSGFVMPSQAEVASLTASQGTANLTYTNSFNIPAGVSTGGSLSFLGTDEDNPDHATESQTLYIPEYDNLGTGSTPATISVTLHNSAGYDVTGTLEFRNYVDGHPSGNRYSVVRNHYYSFEVYSLSGFTLSVVPWSRFDHDIFTW